MARRKTIHRAAPPPAADDVPPPLPAAALGLSLAAYLGLHLACIGRVPAGLCNDAAEEGLRGLRLLAERRLEAVTTVLGNSAETLWLYLVGGLANLVGPTWLALSLPSALAATACVGLVAALVLRLAPRTPFWLAAGLPASSLWLFHYGQSGLRATSSLVFVPLVALLADGSERSPGRAAAAGSLAALSVYAYTSNRLLPVALALAYVVSWARASGGRPAVLRAAAVAGISGLVVSLPNVWALASRPSEFLGRGTYVLSSSPSAAFANFLGSLAFPFWYPERFRGIGGETFMFDGVSGSLAASGLPPVEIPVALAFCFGLWTLRKSSSCGALFLALACGLAAVFLGPAGPSLTRFLVSLPALLAFGAIGLAALLDGRRAATSAAAAALLGLVVWRGQAYGAAFSRGGPGLEHLAEQASAIGRRAADLSRHGERVLSVVSANANTVRFLTAGRPESVAVSEFYGRPLSPREIPVDAFGPTVVLVENWEGFLPWARALVPSAEPAPGQPFLELRPEPRTGPGTR